MAPCLDVVKVVCRALLLHQPEYEAQTDKCAESDERNDRVRGAQTDTRTRTRLARSLVVLFCSAVSAAL